MARPKKETTKEESSETVKARKPTGFHREKIEKEALEKKDKELKELREKLEKAESKKFLSGKEKEDLLKLKDFMLLVYRETNRVDVRRNMKRWMGLLGTVAER